MSVIIWETVKNIIALINGVAVCQSANTLTFRSPSTDMLDNAPRDTMDSSNHIVSVCIHYFR